MRTGPKRTPASSTASMNTSPSASLRLTTRTKPSRSPPAAGKYGTASPASTVTPASRRVPRTPSASPDNGLPRTSAIANRSAPSNGERSSTALFRMWSSTKDAKFKGEMSATSLSFRCKYLKRIPASGASDAIELPLSRSSSKDVKFAKAVMSAIELSVRCK